jgi:hypothetical protein
MRDNAATVRSFCRAATELTNGVDCPRRFC